MSRLNRRTFLETSALSAGVWLLGNGDSQAAIAPGVETKAPPLITGEERTLQPDVWALEVNFKPMRMITVDMPDTTGKVRKQLIWYLVYRAFRRPIIGAEAADLSADGATFVPELTLVTDDNGKQKTYIDRVMPVAQAAINRRERHKYKNSVEIVGPLPPITPLNAKAAKSLDGVAMWRSVDSHTDFFRVYMGGFSNGYRISDDPQGKQVVLRKTLVQQFWRPSDSFEQVEEEIRMLEQPKWIYR